MLRQPVTMASGSAATAGSGSRKVGRIMKAPFRALCRIRDFYVRSLTGCAGRANYRMVAGYPAGSAGIPRSYSFHPSRSSSTRDDDLGELVRAASQGAMGSLNMATGTAFQQSPGPHAVVPRSQSVAIGRIDEDKPCDFGGDPMVGPLYPRSRSCAVTKKTGFIA